MAGVDLGLTPDPRWTVDTGMLVEAARAAGFSALGMVAERARPETAALYGVAALRCHELLALVVRDDPETVDVATTLADAAARVGAEWVLTVLEPPLDGSTPRLVRRCAEILEAAGAKMAVEFYPLSPIDTLDAALEVVEAAGPERSGVIIDSSHFCAGTSSWEDLAAIPLERIAYVQFTDALLPTPDAPPVRGLWRRALPGEGDLPLERFAGTLLERGWVGTVSLEVLNRQSRDLPVDEFARLAHAATARYWG